LRVKVQGYYPYSRRKPLNLSELSFDLLGGQLSVNQLALPQNKIADVKLQNIDLAKLLAMAQYNQVSMTGRVNAVFPFWLEGQDCVICNGEIRKANNEPVTVKLGKDLVEGLKQGGWTESILVDVISELDFQELNARVNLTPDGVAHLTSTIKAYNPQKDTHNPIILNYNHQENVYELWNMIDYGSQFEQNLEHKIYQKLEQK
ncbi:MAG TPA: hypothetical protein DD638_03615, partial [Pasteurellaceae bacterium]|nr:hypothetical protein [Pasteurellaceae bacterium]